MGSGRENGKRWKRKGEWERKGNDKEVNGKRRGVKERGTKGKAGGRERKEEKWERKGGILCSCDFPLGKTLDNMTAYTHRWVRVKPAHYFCDYILDGWFGSRVVSVLDSGAEGPGFKSQSRRCRVTALGKLFTSIVPLLAA